MGGLIRTGGASGDSLGLRAKSLGWLLSLEMRRRALHTGLIEDAPLPT